MPGAALSLSGFHGWPNDRTCGRVSGVDKAGPSKSPDPETGNLPGQGTGLPRPYRHSGVQDLVRKPALLQSMGGFPPFRDECRPAAKLGQRRCRRAPGSARHLSRRSTAWARSGILVIDSSCPRASMIDASAVPSTRTRRRVMPRDLETFLTPNVVRRQT